MSGAGNDFIVIDNRFYRFSREELSGFARTYCPRRTGVGADGLLALNLPDTEGADFRMVYHNADGTLGTMCGNGARCLARFARDAGLDAEPLVFDSDAGLYQASVPEGSAEVNLFVPSPADFREDVSPECGLSPRASGAHYIWTGTEHVVVFVEDVERVDVSTHGSAIRHDPALQPAGANVNFVQVLAPGTLRVRTFEKGVEAETLACGTGSIASSLVAALTRTPDVRQFSVAMPGGTLKVGWEGPAHQPESLWLGGPADVVYRGSLEI